MRPNVEKGGLAIPVFAKTNNWERELSRFREEIGKLKEDLRAQPVTDSSVDDNYRVATRIDLTVNRFLRLWEKHRENIGKQICG